MRLSPLILIVDDEIAILKTLKESLEDEGFRVETLSDATKLMSTLGSLIPDLVLLDIFMPNQNGITLLSQIKKEFPSQLVIMISGFGTIQVALQAIKTGATDFIEKPLNFDEILPKINALLSKKEKVKVPSKTYETYGLIGQSSYFLELMRQVELAAPYDFPILLSGAFGVGKSTMASFIHQKSTFAEYDFETVDCVTLENKNIKKLFENKKTLYAKSIDALDIQGQKLFAHALKENKGLVRCIASTNTSLWTRLQEKQFDPDLFCTLHTFPLEIPTLKNRAGDIPLLITYFLEQANRAYKKNVQLTAQALRLLRNKSWEKNNIHELAATINKLVLCAEQNNIPLDSQDLLMILGTEEIEIIEEQAFKLFNSLEEATKAFEKKFLMHLLKKSFYNLDMVADQLHTSTAFLKNTLTKYNIELKP